MSRIITMSDIHGCLDSFKHSLELSNFGEYSDDLLILCGDYIDHSWENYDVCYYIMELMEKYPKQIVLLFGNHEYDWLESYGQAAYLKDVARWLKQEGQLYFESDNAIYVHAGIDEEAEDLWRVGTSDEMFLFKYPPDTGKFYKDIVAGHIGVNSEYLRNERYAYPLVYHDCESHFYIDGSTEDSGIVPVLIYDTETRLYTSFDEDEYPYIVARR